jgi:hypothetical protein
MSFAGTKKGLFVKCGINDVSKSRSFFPSFCLKKKAIKKLLSQLRTKNRDILCENMLALT